MSISAKEVAKLRNQTGAGMMDCKKALKEADGDFEKAVEILRKKGQKVSAARADRDASEGAVFAKANADNTVATIIELNCETDFVARNEDFQELGEEILDLAHKHAPSTLEELLQIKMEDGRTIEANLTDAMGKIGEKIDLNSYERIEGEKVITYIHPGARVGVAVAFDNIGEADIEEVGKDVAMQIAAMRPVGIDEEGVDPAIIEKEKAFGREKALAEGKPEHIVDKIAEGYMKKFFKENTLLHQEFVKDTSKTVGQYLKEANPSMNVKAFSRIQLGAN